MEMETAAMKSSGRKKTAARRRSRMRYLDRILTAVQTAAAFMLIVRLGVMNILPAGYLAACIVAVLVIGAVLCVMAGREVLAPVAAAVSVLLICGLLYVFLKVNRLDETLQKVSSDSGQTVQMAVAALAGSPAERLEDIGGGKIGCVRDGEGVVFMQEMIDEATAHSVHYEEYDGILDAADALLAGTVNAIVLNNAYIGILSEQEGYEGFSDKVKILYAYEISTDAGGGAAEKPDTGHAAGDGRQEADERLPDKKAFTIYISGIDTFGSINVKSRSDVNILMTMDMESGRVQLINTPRDYYVPLPGRGMDKLTHAGLYGVECSREVLENLYGITIDYYVRVNFSGFEEIIDLLGGIDVYSEYDFTVEPVKHYTVGYNHLSGIEALAFARERHSFAEGDVQRGANQMEVIKAVIAKATSADLLKGYEEILEKISECIQTDIPPETIYSLVRYQLSGKVAWQVDSFTVRGTGSHEVTYSIPGAASYVMLPDEEDVAEAGHLIGNVLMLDAGLGMY